MKRLYYIVFLALLFSACENMDDLFKSYGNEITVIRQVGDFRRIQAGEKFDIILIQDSMKAGTIELTAGENVIDGYTTEVKNGELFIRNDNKFNWVRKLQIRQKAVVYFKQIDHIQINGSAKFSCRDSFYNPGTIEVSHGGLEDADLKINGDYIYLNCTNTGGVNIGGSCFLLSASVDDISFVNSLHLKADKCYINSFSRDDSYISAKSVLDIRLYGTGSVYYRSDTTTSKYFEAKGEGKILKY